MYVVILLPVVSIGMSRLISLHAFESQVLLLIIGITNGIPIAWQAGTSLWILFFLTRISVRYPMTKYLPGLLIMMINSFLILSTEEREKVKSTSSIFFIF